MKKSQLVLALLLIIESAVYSQSPTWEANLGGTINWQRLTPFGILIVSTSEGIKGVDPESGSILWTSRSNLGSAPESSFQMIENTPFFSVQSGSGSNEDFCIIESFEGTQVFSSVQAGMQKVNSQYFLHLSGAILVLGSEYGSKDPSIFMIDMATGNKIWNKEPSYGVVTACKDLGNNECIITTGFFCIKLNVRTGEEIWKKAIDPKFESMSGLFSTLDKGVANLLDPSTIVAAVTTTSQYPEGVFVGVQTTQQKQTTDSKGNTITQTSFERNYMGFNVKDGSYLWPSIKKLPGTMGVVYTGPEGLIVSVGEPPKNVTNLVTTGGADVYCISYSTGEGCWGKKGNGINIRGGVLRSLVPLENNYLLVSGKQNNFIDLVGSDDGTSKIDKEFKVNGQVEYVSFIPKGILYATNEEVNIVDLAEGKKVFDKPIKSTSALLIQNPDDFVVFNNKDKVLYKINSSSGEMSAISPEIEWEGKGDATKIEKRSDGYLISSDQNMVLVNNAGGIVYNKYFPAPTDNAWKKALYYANAVFAACASIVYSTNAGLYGAVSQSIKVNTVNDKLVKNITDKISDAYGDAAKSSYKYAVKMVEKANKRYKATQQTNDFMFILTTEDKKTAQLVRVDKRTGEIANTIYLNKDKTPMYEIDGIENRAFYKSSANKIEGYQY